VAGIGPAVNDDEPIFSKQAVVAGVIDETRDKELLLRPFRKIPADRGAIVEFRKTNAGMRTAGTDDDRKLQLSRDLRDRSFD